MAVVFSGSLASGAVSSWQAVTPARVMLIQLDKQDSVAEFSVDGVNQVLYGVSIITPGGGAPPTYRAADYPFPFVRIRNNSLSTQTVTATSSSI